MEIKLAIKGKEVIIPDFNILFDGKDTYLFAFIGNFDKEFQKTINSKNNKMFFDNDNLVLELKNKYYYFDLSNQEIFKLNNSYNIGFAFYDINNELIQNEQYHVFSFNVN